MKESRSVNMVVIIGMMVSLTACGGGSSNDPPTTDGIWGGTIDQDFIDNVAVADLDQFFMRMSNNQIFDVRINGVTVNFRGSIFADGNVYSGIMNDGTALSIIFDGDLSLGALLADNGWFAVIQKGVNEPPLTTANFARGDLNRVYSGFTAITDFTNYVLSTGNAFCLNGDSCDVVSNGVTKQINFVGGAGHSQILGGWVGNPGDPVDNIMILMSQNKALIAGWQCVKGSSDVNDCQFLAMY